MPPPEEARLEAILERWLAAAEAGEEDAAAWVEAHVGASDRAEVLELIRGCEDALPAEGELVPGQVLAGDFELIEVAGSGGFGSVWKARQLSLERVVALKVLRSEPGSARGGGKDDAAALAHEGKVLAALAHPEVVAVHQLARDRGRTILVMEFVEGESLADALRRDRLLDRRDGGLSAARLVRRVAAVVSEMHRRGVEHRDLKPGNLLLTSGGGLKIADFGLSVLRDGRQASGGGLSGTVAYLPPEALREGAAPDGRAIDAWALGAILLELATGERPYGRGARAESMARAREYRGLDGAVLRPDFSPELRAVCREALAAKPADRYPSIEAFAADLDRFLAGRPVSVSTRSPMRKLAMRVRAERRRVLGLATAAALLGAAAWVSSLLGRDEPPVREVAVEVVEPGSIGEEIRLFEQAAALAAGARIELEESAAARRVPRGSWFFLRADIGERPHWIYVLNRGAAGRVHPNFPYPTEWRSRLDNPLGPGELRVPLGFVAGEPGRDTFLVVASAARLAQLEERLSAADPPSASEVAVVLRGALQAQRRDVVLPAAAAADADDERSTEWFWEAPIEDLRREFGPHVYRWSFDHE